MVDQEQPMSKVKVSYAAGVLAAALTLNAFAAGGLSGCERKEPVFELDTPGLDVEVNKTGEGRTEVEVRTGEDAATESRKP
jgi:hypothetical protein